ncbi:MAG: polysaccharide biosynthesis C-terminal domain-containing protein [Bacteroidia bacterium]|nr:polysaccharide biosynthesis C-terminal domain-containing protein [Bacteroidia bacterium]
MNKKFLKNIIFLLFINLLIKPFWILGIDAAVQNTVGDTSYGLYLAISQFSYLFYILLDLGLTNFNSRNIAQHNQLLSKHFVGISQAKIFLTAIYFIVIFIVGWIIGYRGEQMKILAIVGFNQVLLSFILYVRSNISALLLFKTDSILSVLDRILMILICSFLLWSGLFPRENFNIYWYIYSQTFSYIATLVIAIFIVLKHTGKLTIRINIPFVIMIIKKSLPYALLVLLMSFYNRLEPVLIERILPEDIAATQTGLYARAWRLFDAGNNISYLFSVILLPLFAAVIKEKGDLQGLVKQSFSIILSMTCIIAVLCIFFSKEFMELLYPQQDGELLSAFEARISESSKILIVLMGSFVSISVTYIFGTLLTANGNLKYLNIVAAGGVVLNLTLNFIFIPRFQAFGAAFTSLCVQFTTCMIQFFIAKKIFDIQLGASFWLKLVIFIVAISLTTYFVSLQCQNWLAAFGISALLCIVIAFITKMLSYKEIKELVISTVNRMKK